MSSVLTERQAEVLQRLETEGHTHPKDLALYGGCSDRQAQRYILGESPLSIEVLNRLMASHPNRAVTDALSALVLERSPYVAVALDPDRDLDINRDGKIDGKDAVAAMSDSVVKNAGAMHAIVEANSDGWISSSEGAELQRLIRAAQRTLVQASRIVEAETARHRMGGGR